MANPFESVDGTYVVVVNDEDQHSLWPSHIAIPDGWRQTYDGPSREACLEYIEKNWTDMRPRSLRIAMESSSSRR